MCSKCISEQLIHTMPFNLLSFSPSTILSGLMPGFHEGLARARPLVTNSRGGTREGGRDTDFDCAKKDSGELRNTAVILKEGCVICLSLFALEVLGGPAQELQVIQAASIQQQSMEGKERGQEASQSEERVLE